MKLIFKIALLTLVTLGVTSINGQTVNLQDVQFQSFLKETYPKTINATGELIIDSAATIEGALNCSNRGITNLEGIQYFTAINRLYAVNNQLPSLPNISNLTNLVTLHLANNQLTALPELQSLVNLQELIIFENQLTELPYINNLIQLQDINAYYNQLTTLPEMSQLTQLKKLDIGGNAFIDIIDFNVLTSLEILSMWATNLSSVPDISGLNHLKTFNISGNIIIDTIEFDLPNSLEYIHLDHNRFTVLPANLMQLSNLKKVYLNNNLFTFSALTPITDVVDDTSVFIIMPQATIVLNAPTEIGYGTTVSFQAEWSDNSPNLNYEWYRDEQLIHVGDSPLLTVPNFKNSDEGSYFCKVTKNGVNTLFYTSTKISVNLIPCFDIHSFEIEVNESCTEGNSVEIIPTEGEYVYDLSNTSKTVSSTDGYFTSLANGRYSLKITDEEGCYQTHPNMIDIQKDCNEVLFTPNGDGDTDRYYFNQEGNIKIYDKQGNLLITLQGPTWWDGQVESGKIPVGYYFIQFDSPNDFLLMSVIY